jgi:type IV secretion system protein VirD4
VRAFLIAQSLNQIVKAYGENNAILDNCHVRIAFAANDERTARRISDALGTATEQRAMRNYAGHRLAPWLAHVMVSRQETSRPLLTPGEVMQLSQHQELVLIAGLPPVRAAKLRYFEDRNFTVRCLAAPALAQGAYADAPPRRPHDWAGLVAPDAKAGPAARQPDADGGDMQKAHERTLCQARKARGPDPRQTEINWFDDEDGGALQAAMMPPVASAYGVNQGAERGGDLQPGFNS